jgi:hypothetical protein
MMNKKGFIKSKDIYPNLKQPSMDSDLTEHSKGEIHSELEKNEENTLKIMNKAPY